MGDRANTGRASGRGSNLFSSNSLRSTTALLVYLGLADFVVHMLFAVNYGYFRDELYHIVSGTQHLSLDTSTSRRSSRTSQPSSM